MKNSSKFFGLCLFTSMLVSGGNLSASTLANKEIKCHTQNGEKTFTLSDKFLTFHEHSESTSFLPKRIISSSNPVKTKTHGTGIIQTLSFEGNSHKIVIKDLKVMNEVSDYLSITSPKGHEMTYPITCAFVE